MTSGVPETIRACSVTGDFRRANRQVSRTEQRLRVLHYLRDGSCLLMFVCLGRWVGWFWCGATTISSVQAGLAWLGKAHPELTGLALLQRLPSHLDGSSKGTASQRVLTYSWGLRQQSSQKTWGKRYVLGQNGNVLACIAK